MGQYGLPSYRFVLYRVCTNHEPAGCHYCSLLVEAQSLKKGQVPGSLTRMQSMRCYKFCACDVRRDGQPILNLVVSFRNVVNNLKCQGQNDFCLLIRRNFKKALLINDMAKLKNIDYFIPLFFVENTEQLCFVGTK